MTDRCNGPCIGAAGACGISRVSRSVLARFRFAGSYLRTMPLMTAVFCCWAVAFGGLQGMKKFIVLVMFLRVGKNCPVVKIVKINRVLP